MSAYEIARSLHVGCALVSAFGFLLRAALMLRASALLERRFVRVAPHVVDTLLLAAARTVLATARLNPLVIPWLAAKLVALAAYVVLGAIALRHGRTRNARIAALVGALLALANIFATAASRSPLAGLG